jgi:hypothetical protein
MYRLDHALHVGVKQWEVVGAAAILPGYLNASISACQVID